MNHGADKTLRDAQDVSSTVSVRRSRGDRLQVRGSAMIACLNEHFNSIGQAWEHRNFSMELESRWFGPVVYNTHCCVHKHSDIAIGRIGEYRRHDWQLNNHAPLHITPIAPFHSGRI